MVEGHTPSCALVYSPEVHEMDPLMVDSKITFMRIREHCLTQIYAVYIFFKKNQLY